MHEQTRDVVSLEGASPEERQQLRRKGYGILKAGPFYTNRHQRRAKHWLDVHKVGERLRKIAARTAKWIRVEKRRAKRDGFQ